MDILFFKGGDNTAGFDGVTFFDVHGRDPSADLEGQVDLTDINIAQQDQVTSAVVSLAVIVPPETRGAGQNDESRRSNDHAFRDVHMSCHSQPRFTHFLGHLIGKLGKVLRKHARQFFRLLVSVERAGSTWRIRGQMPDLHAHAPSVYSIHAAAYSFRWPHAFRRMPKPFRVVFHRQPDLCRSILRPGKPLGQLRAVLVKCGEIGIAEERKNRMGKGRRGDLDLSAVLKLPI